MTPHQFEWIKQKYPHMTFEKIGTKVFFDEICYSDTHSDFMIIRRDLYVKSNGKKCYIDYHLKQITVDRSMVTKPKYFTYFWVIRKQYEPVLLKLHNITP